MRLVVISKKHSEIITDAARSAGIDRIDFLDELNDDSIYEELSGSSIIVVEESVLSFLGTELLEDLKLRGACIILIRESGSGEAEQLKFLADYAVPPDSNKLASAIILAASHLNRSSDRRGDGNGSSIDVRVNNSERRQRREKGVDVTALPQLFQSSLLGVALLEELEIVDVNSKFQEIAGRNHRQLKGRSFVNLFHEDDRTSVETVLRDGGIAENVRLSERNGERFLTLEVRHLDSSGKSKLCLVFDVSEYVRDIGRERKLREAYRTVYELSPYPIVVHIGGKILMYNRKAAEFFRSGDDLLGKNLMEFMDETSRSRFLRKIESLMLGFDTCPVEEIRFEIGGDLRETIMNCRLINLSGRELVVSIIVDLTENVRISRLLRIINKINTSLVEFRNRKLILKTALKELEREYVKAFAVIMLNEGFEIIHAGKEEFTRSIENECVRKAMELQDEVHVKQGDHPDYCVYRELHDDYETAVFPLKIGDNLFGFLTILAKRVFMDAEIKLLRTLVGTLAYVYHKSELEEVRAKIMDQLKHNIREFSLVVDRIKNPLAVIYGYCELADEIADAEVLAVKIREEVERITRLVKQLERDWKTSEDLLDLIENMRK